MANVCFIPARDSSKRLPKKNISSFRHGNLITNTIEHAIDCDIFDRIILSSNSRDILDMAKGYDIETHLRDDNQDQVIGVIQQAIPEIWAVDDDNFFVLFVTCPLRSWKDIIEAYKLFLKSDRFHPVVSVKKNENPIQMSFETDEGGHLIPVMPTEFYRSTRKQDHDDTFYFNDAVIIDTVKRFKTIGRTLYGDSPIPYIMPWERSIAIDYEFQLKIAQMLGGLEDVKI